MFATNMRFLFDMLPDIAGIFLAGLGVSLFFVTKELQWLESRPKLRWTLAIMLALIGVGGVVSNAVQKAEDKAARGRLNGDIAHLKDDVEALKRKLAEAPNASVALYAIVPKDFGQELASNRDIQFNIGYMVTANTAKNMRAYQEIFSVTTAQAREAHGKFQGRAAKGLDFRGEDRMVGTGNFITLTLRLTGDEVKEVMTNKRIVYIMARVEWNNPSGSDDHFDVCKLMEQPKIKYLTAEMTAWHDCGL